MIPPVRLWLRLWYIHFVLVRHGLDEIVFATHLFRPFRFLLLLLPWTWFRRTHRPRAERLRLALEDLGPIFIKFGQMLSTRRDLLPDDMAQELAKLQDAVPPFPGEVARRLTERALKRPLDECFTHFDEQPLASASVAQVHAATLIDGREVVVKVLRPGIESTIRRDVGLLYYIAWMAERYWREGRRLRPREVVSEYEKTILDELDLMREAANCSQLRRNFEGSEMLYVPEVHWPLTTKQVMVLERIHGIPISNIDRLKNAGVEFKKLAEMGVEIFFTQVFKHNFFHADMHPGNIFVNPQHGTYIAVDFGIVGTLNPSDQRYLAENFVAFFRRDYRRVAELHVESEWVPAGTRVDEFEAAIRSVCEPIFERPLKEISFGNLLLRLFQTARRFNMEVQPQLVLLQKTLLNIEGLGRQLYPDLDLWTTAKPFLESWVREQMGARALFKGVKDNLPAWGEKIPEIPGLIHEVAKQLAEGRLRVQWRSDELRQVRREIRESNRRTVLAIAGGSCLLGAAMIIGLDGYAPLMFGRAPAISWLLAILAGGLFVAALPNSRD